MTETIETAVVRGELAQEAQRTAEFNQVVYFLYAPLSGLVKIGYSWFLAKRAEEIQALSPVRLELLGVMAGAKTLEADLHRRFGHLRAHGEWFRLDNELSDFIAVQTIIYAWNHASPAARARAGELISEAAANGYRDIEI